MDLGTSHPPATVEEIWAKVRSLKPLIQEHQQEGDRLRRLPDAVAEAFVKLDLYRVQVPRDLGGSEIDPLTTYDLIVEMASYDGAVAWNYAIGAGTVSLCGQLPVARMRELFSSPHCCLAGTGNPPGRAVAVEGGYLLSGRWAWASGIHQAKLVAGIARLFDGDTPRTNEKGGPVMRFCFVPIEQATILDTWHTGGMRGTGSTEWEVSNVFVPEELVSEPFAGEKSHPAPIFNVPTASFGHFVSAVPLGVARGTIEALKRLAESKAEVRDRAFSHYAVAKALALVESAQVYVREAHRPTWDQACGGPEMTIEQRARARRALVHVIDSSLEAVNLCSEAAGGSAVYEAWPFARALRDIHAVRGHVVLSRRFMEIVGQVEFGAPITHPLF